MNRNQRVAAGERRAASIPTGPGWWASGRTFLTIGKVKFPRGSRVPDEIVRAIEPSRLAVLTQNGLLNYRLGVPPADAPKPVKAEVENPAKVAAQQRANMRADGYSAYETDASVKPTPGARIIAKHPSVQVERSAHDGTFLSTNK